MPKRDDIQKVMVIGSGPIVIGQAAEFDYAGAQACRVLMDEGLDVVLVNSNPATIMTDKVMADEIYLEPLTEATVKRIIKKEKPDSLLAGLGGQTGLTIAMQLDRDGFLKENNVKLIGTNVDAINRSEDRELFKEAMTKIGQPMIPSEIANTVEKAVEIADKIGYPVITRPAFTLGGAGGGVAYTKDELLRIAKNGLTLSPINQILVEKYIYGWKEIEFEVMRDHMGNVISVCSMENFDPVGVHTGDSIVVAPALTLADKEYEMLRSAALNIITELKIEGGCNCQFALDPNSFDYAVIEVNPRVSRSSALASKATGYPIAKVTTKIALGYALDEIKHDITGQTCACFEPAIDYVVVKMPKWPFDKFVDTSRQLGTQMKATGEVMSIAPSFEMALLKAVRGAEISQDTLHCKKLDEEDVLQNLHSMDDLRIFRIYEALKLGEKPERINEITKIDLWFIYKIKNLVDYELGITNTVLDEDTYKEGKRLGYTDEALTRISGYDLPTHRKAVYKMVDTCAAEFKAETPYFYSTYDDHCEAREFAGSDKKKIIVLGSGPIRIGQGIEFDYSSVHCVRTLKELGYEVIIINNNPETVSTDFDTSDRLYFEPLTKEDVMNVIDVEQPEGVVVAFGGQTAINLTGFLHDQGLQIFGTSAEGIALAESREKFDALLEELGISRPKGLTVMTQKEGLEAVEKLGFPVLLRPSYVLGGQNMAIAYNETDVKDYMEIILAQGIENPVLIDKYLVGMELEVDVISDGTDVLIPGIMEHVERAGVHSGDSIAMYPPISISDKMIGTIVDRSTRLALSLGTKGLVNIQYLINDNELYVIEVNPRASRTIPYISKVTGVEMVDVATKVMTGTPLKDIGYGTGLYKQPPYVAAKVPVFSFEKLSDVNSALGPEMKSTGEVLGVGRTKEEALFKGMVSAGFKLGSRPGNKRGSVLMSVRDQDKDEIVKLAKKLEDIGLKIYATRGTATEVARMGIDVTPINKLYQDNSMMDLLESGELEYIIFTGAGERSSISDYTMLHRRALQLSVPCITSIDTANALADIIASQFNEDNTELVDINKMRKARVKLNFAKVQSTGNDYLIFENYDGRITFPESLAINFTDRRMGIGADGVMILEESSVADIKMAYYNRDGSESGAAGTALHCLGKYLYDKGLVESETVTIETVTGIRQVTLHSFNNEVTSATAAMGAPKFAPKDVPVKLEGFKVINRPLEIAGDEYGVTCLSMGNPHCVVFCDKIEEVNVQAIGPQFEYNEIFPERTNVSFVRLLGNNALRLRVWERGSGETWASGTGACAAAVAAVENGYCEKGKDITVKVRSGDLLVNYTDSDVLLTADTRLIYEGHILY